MSFTKLCPPCAGKGYYLGNTKDTCTVCKGTGTLTIEGRFVDYKVCGPCKGNGYHHNTSKDTCAVCSGSGLIHKPAVESTLPKFPKPKVNGDLTVFIVHGRNHTVSKEIELFLIKELHLKTRVMESEAHGGRTLAEKFEEIAEVCNFAVFILTADDRLADPQNSKSIHRARQNVILEIGYFWGALGRRNNVAFLIEKTEFMEIPSDIDGIGWIPITADLAEAKLRLRKELEKAQVLKS